MYRALEVILDAGAPIYVADGRGRTPLMIAARDGSMEALRGLVERGADVNVCREGDDCTALYAAADGLSHYGMVDRVSVLLAGGANPAIQTLKPVDAAGEQARWETPLQRLLTGVESLVGWVTQGPGTSSTIGHAYPFADVESVALARAHRLHELEGMALAARLLRAAEAWWRRRHAIAAYYGLVIPLAAPSAEGALGTGGGGRRAGRSE